MLTTTQQAYTLIQKLRVETPGIFYWLVFDEDSGRAITQQLNLFAKIFGVEINAHLIDLNHDDAALQLGKLSRQEIGIYVMTKSVHAHLGKCLALAKDAGVKIKIGDNFDPIKFKKLLADFGYSNNDDQLFNYSAKGEVVTINTPENSWRILFAFDEIEEIKDLGQSETRQSAVKQVVFKKLQFLNLFPLQIDWTELPLKEILTPGGIMIEKDFFKEAVFDVVFQYKRDFKKLSTDVGAWAKKGYKIVAAAVDPEVLANALSKEGLKELPQIVEQAGPAQGFIDLENKFVFLAHADVFGRKQIKERKRRDDAVFVTKLVKNDYVVHEDHGVARYLGLTSTEIEGHKRENLLLEYAKGDKLYVPVELAYKVDKYIGEAKPKLQRLSGTTWLRLSRKANQDAQKFAKSLLKLYAKRSLVKIKSWLKFPEADKKLHQTFGYHETPDQEDAIEAVYQDLSKSDPMDRLVVGDVGFGKTEVALRAAYQAVLNNKQAAILCPTTLLAQQHYDTFSARFKELGVRVEMLSRFTGKVDKRITSKQVLEQLKTGEIDIIIGTHRLLSKDVDFKQIGLIVIDEEQRFGVRHKEKLKQLRAHSHILTLSATPIPRTLYFSLSGLRDITTIKTPPRGRQSIETVIEPYNEESIKKAITAEIKRGGQAFYLYNHVQTIHTAKKRLQDLLGTKVKIDIVHGQMPVEEMARVAAQFDAGKIDVLVCTTIIENGIDLPNVNTLIVHDATRFGLGQLYQIRGRIGRGSVKAHAHFLYPPQGLSGVAARRLQVLEEAKELGSGFELAMRDLEMRGMGQMLGKNQHGHVQKVGLSMYGKLLNQAVEEIESGEVQHATKTVNINLPLDYGIPEALVSDVEERVRLYRLLSQAGNLEDAEELLKPYKKVEAKLSQEDQGYLQNLLHILELRFLAEKSPIKSIDYQEVEGIDGRARQQIEIEFEGLTSEIVDKLYTVLDDFKVVDSKIVFAAEGVKDYYEDVKKLINLF